MLASLDTYDEKDYRLVRQCSPFTSYFEHVDVV
jgi:hypothetical protein